MGLGMRRPWLSEDDRAGDLAVLRQDAAPDLQALWLEHRLCACLGCSVAPAAPWANCRDSRIQRRVHQGQCGCVWGPLG